MSEVSVDFTTLTIGGESYELSREASATLASVLYEARMKHETLDEVGTYLGYRQPGARPHCYGPDDVVVDGDWLKFNEGKWRALSRRATRVRSLHSSDDENMCVECHKPFPCATYFVMSGAVLHHGNAWFLEPDTVTLNDVATRSLESMAESGETFVSAREKAGHDTLVVLDYYINRGMGDCLMSSYINRDEQSD